MHTLTDLCGIRSSLTAVIVSADTDFLTLDLCHDAAVKIDMAIALEVEKIKRLEDDSENTSSHA